MPWTYTNNDFKGDKILRTFYVKELQKTNPREFKAEKSNQNKR